jgi:hypothetical protein
MTDITIPPAAAEALSDAVADLIGERLSLYEARAACLAMLNAWPGMQHDDTHSKRIGYIILPVPKDTGDDK